MEKYATLVIQIKPTAILITQKMYENSKPKQ